MYGFFTDDELEEFDLLFNEPTKESETTVENIDWREAYQLNKTRETCILCGKPTINKTLFSSVIKFCECVDKLSKKDK